MDAWMYACACMQQQCTYPKKVASTSNINAYYQTIETYLGFYNKSSIEVEKIEIGILFEMCFTCFASSNFYINVFEKRRQRALSEIKLVAGGHASKILFLPGSPGISPKYLPKDTARSSKVWDINVDEW